MGKRSRKVPGDVPVLYMQPYANVQPFAAKDTTSGTVSPVLRRPEALNCCDAPAGTLALAGVTSTCTTRRFRICPDATIDAVVRVAVTVASLSEASAVYRPFAETEPAEAVQPTVAGTLSPAAV